MPPIRVVLVDDHTLFRAGLKSVLESTGGAEVVGECGKPGEVLPTVGETHPEIVLVDYNLGAGEKDGISVVQSLRQKFPHIPVIMLTMYEDRDLVVAAAKAGVAGYVLKDGDITELLNALQAVKDGLCWLTPRIAKIALEEMRTYSPATDEAGAARKRYGLTDRELAVLELIVNGTTYTEMAHALLVSTSQIKQLMTSVFQKLDANDKAHAAAIAVAQKLVPPPR